MIDDVGAMVPGTQQREDNVHSAAVQRADPRGSHLSSSCIHHGSEATLGALRTIADGVAELAAARSNKGVPQSTSVNQPAGCFGGEGLQNRQGRRRGTTPTAADAPTLRTSTSIVMSIFGHGESSWESLLPTGKLLALLTAVALPLCLCTQG